MKVIITKYESSNKIQNVNFSSIYGNGMALWEGPIPEENCSYDVEMEIPEVLKWGRDIVGANDDIYSIRLLNNRVFFVGKLESITEDGCCVVRIGESIIFLETEGIPQKTEGFLSFQTESIILYDNNL